MELENLQNVFNKKGLKMMGACKNDKDAITDVKISTRTIEKVYLKYIV